MNRAINARNDSYVNLGISSIVAINVIKEAIKRNKLPDSLTDHDLNSSRYGWNKRVITGTKKQDSSPQFPITSRKN